MQVWCNGAYVGDFPSATGQVLDFKIFGTWHKFQRNTQSQRGMVPAENNDAEVEAFIDKHRIPTYAEWLKPVFWATSEELEINATWDVLEVTLDTYEQIFDHSGFKPAV